MDNNRQQANNNRGNRYPGGGMFQGFFGLLIALVFASFMFSIFSGSTLRSLSNNQSELTYSEFLKKVDDGEIYKVRIAPEDIFAYKKGEKATTSEIEKYFQPGNNSLRNQALTEALTSMLAVQDTVYHVVKVSDDKDLVNRLLAKGNIEIDGTKSSIIAEIIMSLAPFLILWFIIGLFARRMAGGAGGLGGILGVGQSKAKRYMQKETGVTFKDVAGEDEAKESLQEIVDFLHNPKNILM